MTDRPLPPGASPHPDAAGLSGLEVIEKILSGEFPAAPITHLMDYRLTEVSYGHSVFEGSPDERHYNPIGGVHGGYAATLLDSCMGCAVHSTLSPQEAYVTMEFKISLVRGITRETGLVRAIGTLLNRGRKGAFAEGRLEDASGKLLAHGTTTCIIMQR